MVRQAQYSTPAERGEKAYPPNVPGYMYVNGEDPNMSLREMTNRAAQTLFWTELARGFAVTLAHIFKVMCKKVAFIYLYTLCLLTEYCCL